MATQKCPKCGGNNIRHGYRPTHILFKIAFRYNLLCNECNLEFNGFAIPGTVSRKGKKKRKPGEIPNIKSDFENFSSNIQITENLDTLISTKTVSEITEKVKESKKNLVKKRVKVKLNRA
jgi:MoaA/NifB/PqqE/SkfB family radical SAM enzyme